MSKHTQQAHLGQLIWVLSYVSFWSDIDSSLQDMAFIVAIYLAWAITWSCNLLWFNMFILWLHGMQMQGMLFYHGLNQVGLRICKHAADIDNRWMKQNFIKDILFWSKYNWDRSAMCSPNLNWIGFEPMTPTSWTVCFISLRSDKTFWIQFQINSKLYNVIFYSLCNDT